MIFYFILLVISSTNVETISSTFTNAPQSNIATSYGLKETSQSSLVTSYSQLQSASTSSTSVHVPSCCICNHRNASLSSKTDHLINKLRMEKKSLSSYKRTKISAEDDRVTSKYLGWFGGIIVTLLFCFIVFLDVLQILNSSSYFSNLTPK